jgi:nitroreductase
VADLEEIMRTTFSCREFTDQAVSDEDVAGLLELARFASNGGNRQGWRVVAIRSPQTKHEVIAASLPIVRRYVAEGAAGQVPFSALHPSAVTAEQIAAVSDEALEWYRMLENAPILLAIGLDLQKVATIDVDLDRVGLVGGASVYPFVHNILLAARGRGMGGVLTTFAAGVEHDVQPLVGFPSYIALAAIVAIGYPKRTLTRLRRNPVEEFARWESWDGPPIRG